MSKSSLSKLLCANEKVHGDKVIEQRCNEIRYTAQSSINGKVPYGFVKKVIHETKEEESWVNWNLISFMHRKCLGRI